MVKRTSKSSPSKQEEVSSPDFGGYVVAIGASAGGLEALERLFQNLPSSSGAAYVVIQHLSPDHKSMMANLLARHTKMPVLMVEDGMTVESNTVYLIPPGNLMTVVGGRLRLSPKSPRGLSLPIDLFFVSFAQEFGTRAVGVILSGTGSDGTRGAVALNDAGGLLLSQDPESSKFDGMPRSVIATGLVDEILPPEALGPRILEHIQQTPRPQRKLESNLPLDNSQAMDGILHLLHHVGGVNFHEYKTTTVLRRIERRMHVRNVQDYDSYLHLLESDRGEVITLRREILIPVTNFFRDTEYYESLSKSVVARIVEERKDNQPIRVWVAGTSTGEEAYSIAILFAEAFEKVKRWTSIKIFATDVEQQNIDAAGAGVFSEAIMAEVSPERLERYFTKRGNHFLVKSEIRQNIVFARHNLLDDPPFTRMDLVSCRNVLIYFQQPAQERALRRLQYALAPGGYLFQGSSESLGDLAQDFSPVNAKHKIFRILRHVVLPLEMNRSTGLKSPERRHQLSRAGTSGQSLDSAAIDAGESFLLRNYAPPTLMLTAKRELVHVFGDPRHYLHFAEGSVTLDIAKLLPERLVPVALALLHKAGKDGAPIRSEPVFLDSPDGGQEYLRLVARALPNSDGVEPYLLLSFEPEVIGATKLNANIVDVETETLEHMQSLEKELAAMRDSLQATIEELETSNEELQATNEELMASNEELQSSNEELQSVNEELYTVNAENQEKIEILNRLNADLDSMAKAVSIATLFLDEDLKLTRFTPDVAAIFSLRDSDFGRPIEDFTCRLDYPGLMADIRHTLNCGAALEKEVKAADGSTYLVRMLPYAASANVKGVVVSFINITSLHVSQRLQAVLDSLPEHIAEVSSEGVITLINRAWRQFAADNGDPQLVASGLGSNYLEICRNSDDPYAQRAYEGLRNVLEGKDTFFSMEYPCHSPTEQRWFLMYAAPTLPSGGGAIVSHINISTWVKNRE